MIRGVAVVAVVAALACQRTTDAPHLLDAFDDLAPWHATGSEGVTSEILPVTGVHGGALRLGFDLGQTAGYAVARRDLPLALPDNFELSLELRGELAPNNLEIKLIDQSGDNVWWFHRPDYAFPTDWRHLVIKRRQIEFAWGPATDHALHRIAAIELVISAGQGGGKGWVEIDDLGLRPRPVASGPPPVPTAVASSEASGSPAKRALDGDLETAWCSDPAAGVTQQLTVDLGRERDFGGVIVHWAPNGHATDYRVELSSDGARWQIAGEVHGGIGGLDPFLMPGSTARYLRLELAGGATPARGYQLAELAVVELDDVTRTAAANAFLAVIAGQLPRGSLPRGFSGEQPYWTLVGVDGGGGHASLMSEDGAVELASGATIEPFVEAAASDARDPGLEPGSHHITSWATAGEITQALGDGYLPIPSVTWREPGWELTITALAAGDPATTQLATRYTLHNRTDQALRLRLVLAIRPLQVNPPAQFLGRAGGVSSITRLAWADGALRVNDREALRPLLAPDRVRLWPFHTLGYPLAAIGATPGPRDAPSPIDEPSGLASAALAYDLELAPGGDASVVIAAPLAGAPDLPPSGTAGTVWFDAQLAAARAGWHAALDRVGFEVPAAGQPIVDTLRSSLAYMLLSRDGAILRPGTRSYARAWIRDGAMIGEALLRLGHPGVAAAFLDWYAPFQAASGKVPCCVDAHGAGPVPENDSHGELIHLAAEVARYTHDRDQLAAVWPHVEAAARTLDELRASERTPANQTAERAARYGLLPPSISHEGYSAKPAYSYWDDFWGLAGYRDAAWIAGELGHTDAAARLAAAHDDFEHDVMASITASAAEHQVAYIPGAADLGDFDATSTTIGLSPGGEQAALPPALLAATFERAWQQLVARQPAGATWTDYTPYELRLVGAFARLGWRDRAFAALARYLDDRRPRAWNQWAEVVGRLPREPRFIGDMPHAWVCSDYARSVLDLFAYERTADRAIVLAAGLPAAWLTAGVAIRDLPTPYGPLAYEVSATAAAITIRIGPGAVPPGGFAIPWPFATPPGAARINGAPAHWRGSPSELLVTERPATLVLSRSGDFKQ